MLRPAPLLAAALTAAAVTGVAVAADDGPPARAAQADTITYVYGKFAPLTPGKDVFASATCPRGTLAVGGGYTQFDEKRPEEDATNPDVVVSFAGINSTSPPPRFVPRRFEVTFRNTGTNTTTVGSARVTCVRGSRARRDPAALSRPRPR